MTTRGGQTMGSAGVSARRQSGFALIVAIGLMAFILLLSISLTTLVQVETGTATTHKSLATARQNAYFGLMAAIGEIQKELGPDQRVTIPADAFTSTGNGAGKWIGVWDTTQANGGLVWMVSGVNADPTDAPRAGAANVVEMVGEGTLGNGGTASDFVRSWRVPLPEGDGGYAWWVSDESGKASVKTSWSSEAQWQAFSAISSTLKPDSIRDAMSHRVPQRPGLEQIFGEFDAEGANGDQTSSIQSLSQIHLLGGDPTNTFHDATLMSRGLLINPVDGGFKINLTDNAGADPYGFVNDAVEAYLAAGRSSVAGTIATPYRGNTMFTTGLGAIRKRTDGELYEPDPVLVVTPPSYDGSKSVLFPDITDEGASSPFAAPVLTEFALKLGITNVSNNDLNVDDSGIDYIRAEFVYELWNPYPFTLEMSRQLPAGSNNRGFISSRLFVSNFSSKLAVELLRAPGVGNNASSGYALVDSYELDMDNLYYVSPWNRYFNYDVGIPPYIERQHGEADQGSSGNANVPGVLYPGEVYAARRPYTYSASAMETVMQRRANTAWSYTNNPADLSTPPPAGKSHWLYSQDFVNIRSSGTFDITFVMSLDNPSPYQSWDGSSTDNVQLQIRNVPFDVNVLDMPVYGNTRQRYHYDNASDYVRDNFQFGVRFKLKDDLNAMQELAEHIDIRSPVLDWNEVSDLFELEFFGLGDDPDMFVFDQLDLFRHDSDETTHGPENYRFSTYHRFLNGSRLVKLFDVPTYAPVSLDVFRSAFFVDTPPFAFGEPQEGELGSTINAAFDRYFMTGITAQWRPTLANNKPVTPLPNPDLAFNNETGAEYPSAPALRLALARDEAAPNVMIEGSFNLNSTSVDAWAAVLSSSSYVNDDKTASRPGVYIHMPHQPGIDDYMLDRALTDSELKELGPTDFRNTAFTQTLRVLDLDPVSGEPVGIRAVAEALVTNIKEWTGTHGRPFQSIEEFANSGVLKDAIDSSAINTLDTYELPALSPLYLGQGKFLGLISNSLVTRGDTFLIRAYGDSTDPLTGELESRAWVEAVVQRTPEYMDNSQSPKTATNALNPQNETLGRRFHIVAFRWLSENDI